MKRILCWSLGEVILSGDALFCQAEICTISVFWIKFSDSVCPDFMIVFFLSSTFFPFICPQNVYNDITFPLFAGFIFLEGVFSFSGI